MRDVNINEHIDFLYSGGKDSVGPERSSTGEGKDQHEVTPQIRLILQAPWLVLGLFSVVDHGCPDLCRAAGIVSILCMSMQQSFSFCLAHGS